MPIFNKMSLSPLFSMKDIVPTPLFISLVLAIKTPIHPLPRAAFHFSPNHRASHSHKPHYPSYIRKPRRLPPFNLYCELTSRSIMCKYQTTLFTCTHAERILSECIPHQTDGLRGCLGLDEDFFYRRADKECHWCQFGRWMEKMGEGREKGNGNRGEARRTKGQGGRDLGAWAVGVGR